GTRVRAAAKRLPKLPIRPLQITGTTAGHGPLSQGGYIDAAARLAPACAAAYAAPALCPLCAFAAVLLFQSVCSVASTPAIEQIAARAGVMCLRSHWLA